MTRTKEEKKLYRKINISMVRISFYKNKIKECKVGLKEIHEKTKSKQLEKAICIIDIIRYRYSLEKDYATNLDMKRANLDPIYKAAKLVCDNTKLKYSVLEALFNRDRSTLNYIQRTVDNWIDSDKKYKQEYDSILEDNELKYKKYKPRKPRRIIN